MTYFLIGGLMFLDAYLLFLLIREQDKVDALEEEREALLLLRRMLHLPNDMTVADFERPPHDQDAE